MPCGKAQAAHGMSTRPAAAAPSAAAARRRCSESFGTPRPRTSASNQARNNRRNGMLDTVQKTVETALEDDADKGVFRVARDIFTDPEVFELEMKYIFEGNWIYLAHES